MPEGDALSLSDIQKKFTDSLQVIEELKLKLSTLAQTELASAKAGEQLQSASKVVEDASLELKSFAELAKTAIDEFGGAMGEAGRLLQQTTLTELETSVAAIRTMLEGTVIAAQARAEAAEIALERIPEKYRSKYSK
jgi:hypothetical protein